MIVPTATEIGTVNGAERRRGCIAYGGRALEKLGATFRTPREAVKMFLRGFPLFSSWPSARMVLVKTTVRSGIYGRFMGGSDRNTSNSGRLRHSVQFMHIVQSSLLYLASV